MQERSVFKGIRSATCLGESNHFHSIPLSRLYHNYTLVAEIRIWDKLGAIWLGVRIKRQITNRAFLSSKKRAFWTNSRRHVHPIIRRLKFVILRTAEPAIHIWILYATARTMQVENCCLSFSKAHLHTQLFLFFDQRNTSQLETQESRIDQYMRKLKQTI